VTRLITAPAGIPILGVGRHETPSEGACLMEYVALLAGERFSAYPRCTHPALAELARLVNDHIGAAGRSRLARLAPELVGAAPGDVLATTTVLAACLRLGVRMRPTGERRHALDSVLRKLERLRRSRVDRTLARCVRGTQPPSIAVWIAFQNCTAEVLEMPVQFRDRILVELLTDAVLRCRRLTAA
jgi:hypothetical protein